MPTTEAWEDEPLRVRSGLARQAATSPSGELDAEAVDVSDLEGLRQLARGEGAVGFGA